MTKKLKILVPLIVIAIILNEIVTALGLVWYIQFAPFIVVILCYLILVIKDETKK